MCHSQLYHQTVNQTIEWHFTSIHTVLAALLVAIDACKAALLSLCLHCVSMATASRAANALQCANTNDVFFCVAAGMLGLLWTCYPVIWGLAEGSNTISVTAEVGLYKLYASVPSEHSVTEHSAVEQRLLAQHIFSVTVTCSAM
jgi:hypothetical protein